MTGRIHSRVALGTALAAVLALGIWSATRPTATLESPAVAPSPAALPLRAHPAPLAVANFVFEDGAGRPRSLADFRGRHLLVNVWATWCAPCREEMPALSRLQQKLGGPHFQVLALSIDSTGAEAVKRFYGEVGADALEVYVDRSLQAGSALRVRGVPTTLLLDREGRELARHVGPAEWDGVQAVESIRRLMAGAAR